jgi:transcriptional regulator with XRE-family HTH domain
VASDFETRRLEFADRLRSLREQAGRTGIELAAALGWQQSKVSKIERGRQTPADSDVVAWLGALDAPTATLERMRGDLRDLRVEQITWRRQLRDGHRARQEHSLRDARSVTTRRGVAIMAVPGLLQTPDYARAIFQTQSDLLEVPDDVEASVVARIERQRVLYDPSKRIEILIAQAALSHPVCGPDVLAGQLDRLMSVIGLSTVRLGLLPAGRVLPNLLPHGYWILDDIVLVETVSEELRVIDPEQVAIFHRLTDRLWSVAVEGDAARTLLADIAKGLNRTDG